MFCSVRHTCRIKSVYNASEINFGENLSSCQSIANGDLHFIDEYKLPAKDPSVRTDSSQNMNSDLHTDMVKPFFVDIHHPAYVLDRRKTNEGSFSQSNDYPIAQSNIFDKVDRLNVPIWCIDCKNNLVVLGCVDGCLEFWECLTGKLKVSLLFDHL